MPVSGGPEAAVRLHRLVGLPRELEQRLRALAPREASVRQEAYRMLEIITDVVEHLEGSGDDLSNDFAVYRKGGGPYSGASCRCHQA